MAYKKKGGVTRGDRISIFISEDIDEEFLNWINSFDKYSSAIMDLLKKKSRNTLVETEKVEMFIYKIAYMLLKKENIRDISAEEMISEFRRFISSDGKVLTQDSSSKSSNSEKAFTLLDEQVKPLADDKKSDIKENVLKENITDISESGKRKGKTVIKTRNMVDEEINEVTKIHLNNES